MRVTFVNTLLKFARKNPRIILITGDLGFSIFEDYQRQLPNQYLNPGVMEQTMTGIAAGLAIEGYLPIIYSIAPFVTMRNFEQVRNDICYQNLNVKIVGVMVGFIKGSYGHTHHALEDIGVMRTLPNMTILTPGDPVETAACTRAMLVHKGPVYLRIGKTGDPVLHGKLKKFQIGKLIVMRGGKDGVIFATSTLLARGVEVIDQLAKHGVFPTLVSVPTIKPLDESTVIKLAGKQELFFSLEEHSVIGGLGSALAEVIAERGLGVRLVRLGVPDRFTKVMGTTEYMRSANGLGRDQIVRKIMKILRN